MHSRVTGTGHGNSMLRSIHNWLMKYGGEGADA